MATVRFYNHGNYVLQLVRRRGPRTSRIEPGSGVPTVVDDVVVGDVFDVTNSTDAVIRYRPIFITDANMTDIQLQGNRPLAEESLLHLKLENADYESNRYGVDLTTFNPRRVVNSFASEPIFEGYSPGMVDYEIQSNRVLKTGMAFSATHLSQGSSDVKMVYSYSSFAKEWGINLGLSGTVPVKGVNVTGGIDFGYSEFENEERSSTNVFAFTREQRSVYEISINPEEAYLDTGFIIAVSRISDAASARNVVETYGTHYASKVYYGGDRSLYATMNSSTYAKAKGFGIDIKAKVAASKPNKLTKVTGDLPGGTGSTSTSTGSTGSSEVASGSLGFQYSESKQESEILQEARSGYIAIGGQGGFDGWGVTEDNAVPVAVELQALDELVTARVFKNGTLDRDLVNQKRLLNDAITRHLTELKTLGQPLPAPRVYSVILKRIEVIDEVDDLDMRTRGSISAAVSPPQPGFDGSLWHTTTFDERNLRYRKGNAVTPNTTKSLVQAPETNGVFAPLQIRIDGSIEESDHAGGAERHTGTSNFMQISPNLGVGQEQTIITNLSAYTTFAERGSIRVTAAVRRDPSDFSEDLIATSRVRTQPTTRAGKLASGSGGKILGIGLNNTLWTRDTLTSGWQNIPNSGSVIGVTVLPDGRILGIGMNNTLWTRDTLTSGWQHVPSSGSVIGVTVLPDERILGIGLNNTLWTRDTLTSGWQHVPNSGSVIGVTVLQDGRILGIGMNNTLWTRDTLTSGWQHVPNSGSVIGISVLSDGRILGIGLSNTLWTRDSLTSGWQNVPNSGKVIGVTVLPNRA